MERLYIAGSLFNEAEVNQRIKEGNMIESLTNYEVYNPIQAPCNNKNNIPSSKEIFWGDTKEILKANTVVADISNQSDPGTAAELGIVWACNYIHDLATQGKQLFEILEIMKRKKVITHLSDIRKSTAHQYENNYIPWGCNQYLVGMVEDMGIIKNNFQEVLNELV